MTYNPPVPRPPQGGVRHCAACDTKVIKPVQHCTSKGCDWWRCPNSKCDRPMNDTRGHAVRWRS